MSQSKDPKASCNIADVVQACRSETMDGSGGTSIAVRFEGLIKALEEREGALLERIDELGVSADQWLQRIKHGNDLIDEAKVKQEKAEKERDELRAAVLRVVSQSADDICWMDVYRDLGLLDGVAFDPKLLPRATFARNCARYAAHVFDGKDYQRDEVSEENVELRKEVVMSEAKKLSDGLPAAVRDMLEQMDEVGVTVGKLLLEDTPRFGDVLVVVVVGDQAREVKELIDDWEDE